MSDETPEKRGTLTQGLTHAKTLGDVVRVWGVLAIALLTVAQPEHVKSWVRDAGIKKLLDVEFSEADAKKIEAAQQELKDSRLVFAQLGENLGEAQKVLHDVHPEGEASANLGRQLEMAAQVAQTTSDQLGDALEKVRPLAQKAAVVTGTATGEWAVIFGGDADLASHKTPGRSDPLRRSHTSAYRALGGHGQWPSKRSLYRGPERGGTNCR